jgi:hypothetical protein
MKNWIWTIALLLADCSGKTDMSPSGPSDALTPNTLVTQLSSTQEKALCGWLANLYGGYGSSLQCDSGASGSLAPNSEGDCVQQFQMAFVQASGKFSHCPATVGQVQACVQWHAANACVASGSSPPAACTIVDGPQCS